MIYILKVPSPMSEDLFIFQTDVSRPNQIYLAFMEKEAGKRGIVINSHWLNIMDKKHHHPHLSDAEYKSKEKEWRKFLKSHSLLWFFREELKAKELESETLYM